MKNLLTVRDFLALTWGVADGLPATGWRGYGKPGVTDPATRDEYTRLDLLETKAANVSGITAWEPDTALAYESAVIPHRG